MQVHSGPDEAHQLLEVGSHDEFAGLSTRINRDTTGINFDGQIHGCAGFIIGTEGKVSILHLSQRRFHRLNLLKIRIRRLQVNIEVSLVGDYEAFLFIEAGGGHLSYHLINRARIQKGEYNNEQS
jgi:hypothetical protein